MVITYAAWNPDTAALEVDAYVQDKVEYGGTCTVTASGPGRSSASADAEADATSTTCAGLTLPNLAPGRWDIEVEYDSDSTEGTSSTTTVTVP